MAHQKTICIDFDGVLHDYSEGYKGLDVFGKQIPGAAEAVQNLKKQGWQIIIFTARPVTDGLKMWLKENDIPFDFINENPSQLDAASTKPYADIYLDDRGLQFKGNWQESLKEIAEYKNWQGFNSAEQE
jgi:phosphoglycolate phosphatase-like HAD superfamily hydrolase